MNSHKILITADTLIDATGAPTRHHAGVVLQDGRITEIVDQQRWPSEPSVTRLHFPGCTILPGMIDTHVHLCFADALSNDNVIADLERVTDGLLLQRCLTNARRALLAGITTVRDCGGRHDVTFMAQQLLRCGDVEGADLLVCGMPITTRWGHCHWLGLIADHQSEACQAAERMLAQGADFLKVMATGGNMTVTSDPMKPQYDDATLAALVAIGRRAGKHTAAHVLSRSALPGAIRAGVRTIEHCDWRVEEWRYDFDPQLAREMIAREQFAGLTMSGTTRRRLCPNATNTLSAPSRRLDARFACERRMLDAGVRFTLHSDAGVQRTPIDSLAIGLLTAELELQLSPLDVIRAVTASAAEAIELNDRGILAPGRRADLLVVDGDASRDLTALSRVRAVWQAGRRIPRPGERTETELATSG